MNGPGNPIGWCDYTWNPVTGCKHGCRFGGARCYAEAIAARFSGSKAWPNGFEPTFHPHRLEQPRKAKEPARIFVCSMADLFGAWVPQEWIDAVLAAVRRYPQHTFQMLTKSPKRAASIEMPPNAWLGSTITGGLAGERGRLDAVRRYQAPVRFLSCEPLCGPVDVARAEPDWLIIGAATGPGGFQPDEGWVDELERWADERGCPIYHKENLACRASSRRTEFPGTARA